MSDSMIAHDLAFLLESLKAEGGKVELTQDDTLGYDFSDFHENTLIKVRFQGNGTIFIEYKEG